MHLAKKFKDVFIDMFYVIDLKFDRGKTRNLHVNEYIKYKNILYDLFKFVPISIMTIVPVLEFLIPLYLVILPNAMPTQFRDEKSLGKNIDNKNNS